MMQPDLFAHGATKNARRSAEPAFSDVRDLPAIIDLLSGICARPRYTYMVLNLIAQVCDGGGEAGPYVRVGERRVPIRDWLSDAMMPIGRRDPRRIDTEAGIRDALAQDNALPADRDAADRMVDQLLRQRMRRSGRTNVSRAVSELVRAGLMRRHYQGYRVDHHNRGGHRLAVYTIKAKTLDILRRNGA